MKRFLAMLLALTIAATSVACTNKSKTGDSDNNELTGEVIIRDKDETPSFEAELPSANEALPTEENKPVEQDKIEPEKQEQSETPKAEIKTETVSIATENKEIPMSKIQPAKQTPEAPAEKHLQTLSATKKFDEVRAIWISYLDFNTLLKGKTQQQFTENIGEAFTKSKNLGMNTVIVQVRPFGDALYKSEYFPWSYTITGTEGKNPGFDPLKIMIREAHNRGLKIEAWINPYRIRTGGYYDAISDNNIAMKLYNDGSDAVIKYNGGYYYNPASKKARQLITDGVVEIVDKYDVDGIHFDDYFYPTTDAAFDKASYNKTDKSKSLADWRRNNVNLLIKGVYSAIKEVDETVTFGISPQGNISNNYNQQYSDVELWMSKSGYVDYICPQIYWGFKHETAAYKKTVEQWSSKIRSKDVDLYIGLAPYKLGTTEASYAGAGINEWKNTKDILARMVETARTADNYDGFVLFRYDSVFNPAANVKGQVKAELASLKEEIKAY